MLRVCRTIVVALAVAGASGLMMIEPIPANQPPWPEADPPGLRELSTSVGRVLGSRTWFNSSDWVRVYFAGDAYVFNRFLKQYAALQSKRFHADQPLTLVLHDVDFLCSEPLDVPVPRFNWRLLISRTRGEFAVPLVEAPVNTDVQVEVWISPRLLLSELRIPPGIRVRTETSLEDFARKHEEARLGGRPAYLERQIADFQQQLGRRSRAATRPALQPTEADHRAR